METNIATLKIHEDINGKILKVEVNVPLLFRESNGTFTATDPVFNSLGFSNKSSEDAIQDQREDLRTFFAIHVKRGTLKQALHSLGWQKEEKNSYKKQTTLSEIVRKHSSKESLSLHLA